ncbi:MAG: hypothetical protein WAR22_04650 [Desulfomonilia bacterium]|jgi:hypothetical protein
MSEVMFIPRRFCGPPDSANGGYVCGLMAGFVGGTAEVRLRKPPPLERPLAIIRTGGKKVCLMDGETLVAEAAPAVLELETPPPPSYTEALEAMRHYVSEDEHFFPTCFVCGPARKEGDGLRIFPGPLHRQGMAASVWVPDETLSDGRGMVRPEFVWASLDCPGAWAVMDTGLRPIVLGSLASEVLDIPAVGQRCIAVGWKIAAQGRKRLAGTALFTEDGDLLARARSVWIEI